MDIWLHSEGWRSANCMFSSTDELSGDVGCRFKMNLKTIKVSEETEKIGGMTRKRKLISWDQGLCTASHNACKLAQRSVKAVELKCQRLGVAALGGFSRLQSSNRPSTETIF